MLLLLLLLLRLSDDDDRMHDVTWPTAVSTYTSRRQRDDTQRKQEGNGDAEMFGRIQTVG